MQAFPWLRLGLSPLIGFILIFSLTASTNPSYAAVTNPYAVLPNLITHSMTARVSFISEIDRNQLAWNLA